MTTSISSESRIACLSIHRCREMGPSAFAFAFVASIDSIRFFGPAMAPRMQARKRPSSTALPAAKVAKTRQDTTALVAELVTALKRSFHQNRNTKDATAMAGYVSLGLLRSLNFPLRRKGCLSFEPT